MRGTTASQRRSTPATAALPPPAIAPGEKAAPLADDAPLNFSAAALIATHSCLSCSTREARILLIYARSFSARPLHGRRDRGCRGYGGWQACCRQRSELPRRVR